MRCSVRRATQAIGLPKHMRCVRGRLPCRHRTAQMKRRKHGRKRLRSGARLATRLTRLKHCLVSYGLCAPMLRSRAILVRVLQAVQRETNRPIALADILQEYAQRFYEEKRLARFG